VSRPVLVTGRGGMGDAIYSRPFVRAIARRNPDVQVSTSWPDIFADLPVEPVKRIGGLKTQAYHGEQVPASVWAVPRTPAREITLRYRWDQLARGVSILAEMEHASRIRPDEYAMDLPPLPPTPVGGAYAVVRPPAIRLDYPAPAREPMPEYLADAATMLSARGLKVVTVGAWVPGLEEPNGQPLPADLRFEQAELSIPQLLALVAGAAVVVSGPCWLIPACMASGTPLVVIAGGCGGRNNPQALADRRVVSRVRWLLPDRYCARCSARHHNCPKVIPNFAERLGAEFDVALAQAVAA
jgi:hypothetical protein